MNARTEVDPRIADNDKYGFWARSWDYVHDNNKPPARLIMGTLSRKAGQSCLAWGLSLEDIAEDTGITIKQVRCWLTKLEANGSLAIEHWGYTDNERGLKATSLYVLYPVCRDYDAGDLKVRHDGYHIPSLSRNPRINGKANAPSTLETRPFKPAPYEDSYFASTDDAGDSPAPAPPKRESESYGSGWAV